MLEVPWRMIGWLLRYECNAEKKNDNYNDSYFIADKRSSHFRWIKGGGFPSLDFFLNTNISDAKKGT